jgi:hypothetical protein
MKNFLLLPIGVLLIGLLSIVCFKNKLEPITNDLITKTSEKLNKNEIYGLGVSIVGKDFKTKLVTKISGIVMSKKEKEKALSIARSIDGVFDVEDDIKIEKAKILGTKMVFEPVENNLTNKKDVTDNLTKNENSGNIKLFKEDSILPGITFK